MAPVPNDFNEFFNEIEPFAIGVMIAILAVYLVFFVFALVSYVLNSAGLYSIAKRRGIHHPGLAWVPIANAWVLGSISDQYHYVTRGKLRSRRKLLLAMSIVSAVLPVLMIVAQVVLVILEVSTGFTLGMTGSFLSFIIIWLVMVAFLMIRSIFTFIALYDLYYSCNPESAAVLLVLSIFILITKPILVFASRKKDLGMPRRKKPETNSAEFRNPPEQAAPQKEPEVVPADTEKDSEMNAKDNDLIYQEPEKM